MKWLAVAVCAAVLLICLLGVFACAFAADALRSEGADVREERIAWRLLAVALVALSGAIYFATL